MIEEEENNEIRKILRSLPPVKSGSDFLEKLDRRIATIEPERKSAGDFRKEKPDIFGKVFGGIKSAWLAPALGLAAAVIFVFYITFMNKQEVKDEQISAIEKTEVKKEPDNIKENTPKTELSPSSKPQDIENKTESSKNPERDITGNFEYKESEKTPLQTTQPDRNLSDQDESGTEIPKSGTMLQEGIIKENDNSVEKRNDEIVNDGGKATEKSRTTEENKLKDEKSNKTPGEKMEEFEKTIQKSILDKLNAVNKTNLESLSEKVNK